MVTVGRLDFDTEGLLLLTNDGALARLSNAVDGLAAEIPRAGIWLHYREIDCPSKVRRDDRRYQIRPVSIERDIEGKSNTWLTLGIREGKNREIRKLMEHVGLKVNRLIRISYGPFQLGELPEGEVQQVRQATLKEQLGIHERKLARRKQSQKHLFKGSC